MNELWAKWLLAGDKTWADVPTLRRPGVYALLEEMYKNKEINKRKLNSLTKE